MPHLESCDSLSSSQQISFQLYALNVSPLLILSLFYLPTSCSHPLSLNSVTVTCSPWISLQKNHSYFAMLTSKLTTQLCDVTELLYRLESLDRWDSLYEEKAISAHLILCLNILFLNVLGITYFYSFFKNR